MTHIFDEIIKYKDILRQDPRPWTVTPEEFGENIMNTFNLPIFLYSKAVYGLENELYSFASKYPQYSLHDYCDILRARGIEWSEKSMIDAGVSDLDAQGVLALLLAAYNADILSEGTLKDFLDSGVFITWLYRLEDIKYTGEGLLT